MRGGRYITASHGPLNRTDEAMTEETKLRKERHMTGSSSWAAEHEALLNYYFGEPTSTHKSPGYHLGNIISPW